MSKSQRRKGSQGELELCSEIRDLLGVRLVRNLDQVRQGGFDLVLADPEAESGTVAAVFNRLAIEVKRHAVATPATIADWWSQAAAQAATLGLLPVLAYRADRRPWRVRLPLHALHSALPRGDGPDDTVEVGVSGFCAIVREVLAA